MFRLDVGIMIIMKTTLDREAQILCRGHAGALSGQPQVNWKVHP
jgi:hypothetical protein